MHGEKKILTVFGTRPEAIKMAPVLRAFEHSKGFESKLLVSGQHDLMLQQVLSCFDLKPELNLNVMVKGQTLNQLSSKILALIDEQIERFAPDFLIVHGDTTTAAVSALAAHYRKVRVIHVEAGLRSGNLMSPWPEEANRKLISQISDLNFSPTEVARHNLIREGIAENTIFVTGNTVVDAVRYFSSRLEIPEFMSENVDTQLQALPYDTKKIIVFTVHRRENFKVGIHQVISAIKEISNTRDDVLMVLPVHPNPNVSGPIRDALSADDNVVLTDPLDYISFVYLLKNCFAAFSDSGGIQEEAPFFKKPVMVLRDTTERPELIQCHLGKLIGVKSADIVTEIEKLCDDAVYYRSFQIADNPFGDGFAAERIVSYMENL